MCVVLHACTLPKQTLPCAGFAFFHPKHIEQNSHTHNPAHTWLHPKMRFTLRLVRAIHANLFGGGSHRCAVSRRGRSYLCSSFLVDSLCQSAQCSCCFTSIEHSACQVPTQHGSTSSQTCVVHKCQLFTQDITKAMILCKYSRYLSEGIVLRSMLVDLNLDLCVVLCAETGAYKRSDECQIMFCSSRCVLRKKQSHNKPCPAGICSKILCAFFDIVCTRFSQRFL